jgi:hypothetical protein
MTCELLKTDLLDAAASGVGPGAELSAHLQACQTCRSAFERERNLFHSIDAGLRSSANVELPPLFLQRVRTRISQQPAVARVSILTTPLVSALAVAAIALFVLVQIGWRPGRDLQENKVTTQQAASAPVRPKLNPPQLSSPPVTMSPTKTMQGEPSAKVERKLRRVENSSPETLVPRDQEVLLAHYAEELQSRPSPPRLIANANDSSQAELRVELIQIAQLDVKPLAEQQE